MKFMMIDPIIKTISNYKPVLMKETSLTSAVLVLVLNEGENFFLILTKRSDSVADYAGDYCFPGGHRESSDVDFRMTAVRETEEEIGLKSDYYKMVGQLDDFLDRHGNLVRPFVALMEKSNFEKFYIQNTDEIAELYYFPIMELDKLIEDPTIERITNRHPSYRYERGQVVVWGLTASIMVHLGNIIFGWNKKVGKGNPIHPI